MWRYYILLIIAVFLFSIQFVFTKVYQKQRGNSFLAAIIMGIIACIAFIPYYLILNGGKIEFTIYSFFISLISSLLNIVCTVFGLKVLSVANLSVYSIFLLLGGMLVPSVYGLLTGEKITSLKVISILFVIVSLLLTVQKDEKNKKTSLYAVIGYAIIFLTNGLTSVCTFMHQKSNLDTVSTEGYLLLGAFSRLALSLIILIVYMIWKKIKHKEKAKLAIDGMNKVASLRGWMISIAVVLGYAAVHGTAQLLSTMTATYLDASVQSTIITGGCIFLSAAFGLFFGEQFTKKGLLSLSFALVSVVLMTL